MSRYIVTGGAGFIGSHLTDMLIEEGHEVIVIDDFSVGDYRHPQAEIVKADITDEETIRPLFKDIDGCFHLTGIPSVIMTMENWFRFHAINFQSSLIVFKLAINAGNIPVVYASSCAIYGETKQLPLKENLLIKPLSSYGCDKLSIELNSYALAKNFQLPSIGLRFFNVYGPGQNPQSPYSGVITRFILNLKANKAPIIYGDGNQTRDFIFVKDVAKAVMKAMSIANTEAQIVNLCTGIGVSINQLAHDITRIMQKEILPEYHGKRSYDITHSVGCTEKMKSMGFSVNYDLISGLKETIDSMC